MDIKSIVIVISLLVLGVILLYSKIKSSLFNNTQEQLVKDDAALKVKEDNLKEDINKLKQQQNPESLTPSEVEDFWKKH